MFYRILSYVIVAIVCGVLGWVFRGPESALIEQGIERGKELAYAEIEAAKNIGKKL